MEQWLITRNFFHGLTPHSQEHLDAEAGGAFLSLDVAGAKVLVDKIASHQSWKGERQSTCTKRVHQIDSIDMLVAKMDILMKMEPSNQEMTQIVKSHIMCEMCGDSGHSGIPWFC